MHCGNCHTQHEAPQVHWGRYQVALVVSFRTRGQDGTGNNGAHTHQNHHAHTRHTRIYSHTHTPANAFTQRKRHTHDRTLADTDSIHIRDVADQSQMADCGALTPELSLRSIRFYVVPCLGGASSSIFSSARVDGSPLYDPIRVSPSFNV